ncbi:MAG: inorganic diphosphatase [Gemmatimonadota bacterium]
MHLHPWHDLPTGPDVPTELNAIIEIPRGSRNKYELDKASGLFRFDRLLYSAVHYPADYGLIPRTLADDADPLDVLVMVTEPTFPGCLIRVRPLGVFAMRDEKGRDEKLLTVPVRDPLYDEIRRLDDLPAHFLREVEHFFAIYKDLEGIETEVLGWNEADDARALLRAARERYMGEFGGRDRE